MYKYTNFHGQWLYAMGLLETRYIIYPYEYLSPEYMEIIKEKDDKK